MRGITTRRKHPGPQAQLQEAMREIRLMAGFEQMHARDLTAPGQRASFTIGVTSPHYGDGKTMVSMALASSISQDIGKEVLLADLDFHTHSVGREYGFEGGDGLFEVISGDTSLDSVLHRIPGGALTVATAGGIESSDAARTARSNSLMDVMDRMRAISRYVVCDLPTALHSMSTPVLAQRCDGVIVVVRAGQTSDQDLQRSLHLLRDSRVVGVVINRQHSRIPRWVQRVLGIRD
jgi:Mrp family chromosome partitioning ATPase